MQIVDDFYDVEEDVETPVQKIERENRERKERMAQRKLARQKRQLEELREMGVIPNESDDVGPKKEFEVKHAPDII